MLVTRYTYSLFFSLSLSVTHTHTHTRTHHPSLSIILKKWKHPKHLIGPKQTLGLQIEYIPSAHSSKITLAKATHELSTIKFNFSCSILIFLTSLFPWYYLSPPFLKLSLVQLFLWYYVSMALSWPHWLFRFELIFPHLKVDKLPPSVLSVAIFCLCSPLAFVFPPTPSTISLMLMSPKSVFWTVAWVLVSHFQLPIGEHIYVQSCFSSKVELPSIPYHTGVDSPSTLPLDLSDFFNGLSSCAWLFIVIFTSSFSSASYLLIRF